MAHIFLKPLLPTFRLTLGILLAWSAFLNQASAEPLDFNLRSVAGEELRRLGEETADLVKTPTDMEHGGLFGTVAAIGGVALLYSVDGGIRSDIRSWRSSGLDRATDVGSIMGNPLVHLGVAATVYGGGILAGNPKYRQLGEMFGESLILADATTMILKQAIGRGRPTVTDDKSSSRPFQFRSEYDSAPSLHTASSFALASVAAAAGETLAGKALPYLAAGFVGFSRIYQDKHWASDVLFGAVLGELCGRVVVANHANRRSAYLIAPSFSTTGASLNVVSLW